MNVLYLNASREGVLTSQNLEYETNPIKTDSTSILYVIEKPPQFGTLFMAVSKYHMRVQDTFSQEDISSNNLRYELFRTSYSVVEDEILYTVMAPGCKNLTGNLSIVHHPTNETLSKVQALLKQLTVEEGGRINIGSSHLNIWLDFVTDLLFNVTSPPAHGILQIDRNGSTQNATHYFTLSELRSNQLFYLHDGSETKQDSFTFLAISPSQDFQYSGSIYIDIILINDNSPVRTVDKVFHVVVGGKRLLTGDDLRYSDADLDTKSSEIMYTWHEIPNGEIYNSSNPTVKLSQFTQDDLDNKRVLFKHKGPEFAKFKLWVTDGQFFTNGVLDVQASPPFIHVFTNKKLVVQQGKSAVIKKDHLFYVTNLYAFDKDVVYEVIAKPAFGKIVNSESFKVNIMYN